MLNDDFLDYPFVMPSNGKLIIESLSGGAAKFSGIAGAGIKAIELGYKPNVILGISSGAIASIPLALGLFCQMRYKGDNLSPNDFFVKNRHPIGKKGKVSLGAIFRVLGGANTLGEQDVSKLLKEVITESLWDEYKHGDYADCIVGYVRAYDAKFIMSSLKLCPTREQAIYEIMKSSKITPIVKAHYQDGVGYIDGGFRSHNMAGKFLDRYKNVPVESLVSVFARSKDFDSINRKWDKNIIETTFRGYEIMNIEISKKDEYMEKVEMERRGISDKHVQIFMPSIDGKYSTGGKLKRLRLEAEANAILEYTKVFGENLV